ncbi:MAG: peptidoglycan DD-metalloendopeptidase family protein [Robiginitomaculum sp.]|nr:peptidoglycan DD-metalloendopeptidase family protein [Robiginitomaculum sp.]
MYRKHFVFIVFLASIYPAYAQTPDPKKLDILSQKQKIAEEKTATLTSQQLELQQEIESLQNGLVRASAQSRGYEFEAGKISKTLVELTSQEQALKNELLGDKTALADFLVALQRIEKNPPPFLLTSSQSVKDAVRTAHLIKILSLSLKEKSNHLAKRITELQLIQRNMLATQVKLTHNTNEIATRLRQIKSSISKKAVLNKKLNLAHKEQEERAKALALEAKNLRDLISRFEEQAEALKPRLKPEISTKYTSIPYPILKPKRRSAPTPIYTSREFNRFSDARGKLSLPVLGTLSRKYGSRLKTGNRAKGVYLKTRPKAQVVAPFAARVEFSGVFNDMTVIILNVGNGYFIVLTGLATAYSKAGDTVKAGEPLGLMPDHPSSKPELFMEFRKNKTSISPMPWIKQALKQ